MNHRLLKSENDWNIYLKHLHDTSTTLNTNNDSPNPLSFPCILIWTTKYSDHPYSSWNRGSTEYDFVYLDEFKL